MIVLCRDMNAVPGLVENWKIDPGMVFTISSTNTSKSQVQRGHKLYVLW